MKLVSMLLVMAVLAIHSGMTWLALCAICSHGDTFTANTCCLVPSQQLLRDLAELAPESSALPATQTESKPRGAAADSTKGGAKFEEAQRPLQMPWRACKQGTGFVAMSGGLNDRVAE